MGRRVHCLGYFLGVASGLFAGSASAQLFTYGRQDVLGAFSDGSAVAQIAGVPVATAISSGSLSAWTDNPLCQPSPQTPCTFNVNSIRLNVASFTIGNVSISNLTVWTWNPIGNLADDGSGANVANAPFAASFLVDGRPNAINLTPVQPFKIFFNPSTESLVLSGVLQGTYAGSSVVLTFLATANRPLRNRPPILGTLADMTLTTDCVAEAYVDASATMDPNGNLSSLYVSRDGHAEASGTGNIGPVLLTPGKHDLSLVAVDNFGAQSAKQVHVTVTDNGNTPNVTGMSQVTFTVPTSKTLKELAILTTSSIAIADRSRVILPTGQGASIANLGTGTVDAGVSTLVGTMIAKGPVSLRENATIQGDLQTSATVSPQNNVTVTGTRQERATINTTNELRWNLFVPSATRSQQTTIGPDAVATLQPKTYGPVSVQARSTLVLQSGVYDLTSLTAESQSTIQFVGKGPTVLIVQSGFTFRGTIVSQTDPSKILTIYRGSNDASIELPWMGTFVAPNALARIGALVPSTYVGAYIASRVEIRPDTTLRFVPFDWQSFQQARHACVLQPVAECIRIAGGITYARFGYTNRLKYEGVGLLPGMFNRTDGDSSGVQLPYAFQPGQVHAAVDVPMPSASVSWILGYTYATATRGLPTCP